MVKSSILHLCLSFFITIDKFKGNHYDKIDTPLFQKPLMGVLSTQNQIVTKKSYLNPARKAEILVDLMAQ